MAIGYRSTLGGGGGIEIDSLTVTTMPTKTTYLEGQSLDTTGAVITAVAGLLSGNVASECTYSPTVLTTAGTQAITVSYGGQTATFNVTVEAATLSLTSAPTKTEYIQGDLLDLTGMVVTLSGGGTTEDVTSQCTFSPANGSVLNVAGTITITATFGIKTVTTSISVYAISAIAITTPPTKVKYRPNEQLDLTGIVVTATAGTLTQDVTALCTFNPTNGTTLTTEGTFTLTATYNGFTATTTYRVASVEMVAWATGTDEQLKDMADAYYDGLISLDEIKDYWHVGDERTVALSAMSATGVGESHVAQNVTMVIMGWGGKKLSSDGTTDVLAIVGQKDCLNEKGYVNSSATNVGGWNQCARRTWCNNTYKNAFPSTFSAMFKQFQNKTTSGNQSTSLIISDDYFSLFAGVEVGTDTSSPYDTEGSQVEYYTNTSHRIKKAENSDASWWLRSPNATNATSFRDILISGEGSSYSANNPRGIAPFGCI